MSDKISILLIEDDLVDQMAMKSAITKQGLPYKLDLAKSVAEARRLLTTSKFDLIVTDYKLTDGTAFELFDLFKDQLVIFTTGSGDEETAVQAMQSGARDYMIKDPDRHYLKLLSQRVEIALRQQKAERLLRETEERYRDVVENATDLIYTTDLKGRLQFVNRAWQTTLGIPAEEAINMTLFDVLHAEDRDAIHELFGHLANGDEISTVELRFLARDGRVVEAEGKASCRFQNGVPQMTRGIFRDVTQRNQDERERHGLVERLQEALSAVSLCLSQTLKKPSS